MHLKTHKERYLNGHPDDMHRRMAREIARIEDRYPNPLGEGEIYEVFRKFKYIVPQGGSMAGIGNNRQIVSLSNCFVIGTQGDQDSYGAVMQTDEEQVQLMKRRGGVGHDLSGIRPKGSPVMNSAVTLHRRRSIHGEIFELHKRGGPGRKKRGSDVIYRYQTSGYQRFHQC